MTTPEVSVIITFYDTYTHVARCVFSVLRSKGVRYEIVVIDDNSPTPDTKIVQNLSASQKVSYTYLPTHSGIAKSRNIGASAATGDFVFFLDADRTLAPDTIVTLHHDLHRNKTFGLLQPLLFKNKRSLESSGHSLSWIGLPYNLTEKDNSCDVKRIFGARGALMVRKKDFMRIGGYDEDHRLNGEDTDLSWRMWLSGKAVGCSMRARAYHHKEKKEEVSERMMYRVYYSGSKTVISMILKNAPGSTIVWMLPLALFFWLGLSIRLVFLGKIKHAFWIYRGIWWNIAHVWSTMSKRAEIDVYRTAVPRTILYGPVSVSELISRGHSF